MKNVILTIALSMSSFVHANDAWDRLPAPARIEVLDGYAPPPPGVTRVEFHVDRKTPFSTFVRKMVSALERDAETYNPDFPFKRARPEVTARIAFDTRTRNAVGGSVYVIRELEGDGGRAWIDGSFDPALRSLDPASEGVRPRWSHY